MLVARLPDGSWSSPSGILLHTAGLGFMVGVDIYDCVVVINSDKALEAFTNIRCTLGGEISVAAGPVGAGGILETGLHKRQAPVYNYMKTRGFYAGVQIDGTVIIERTDENERFYGERIPVRDILAGKARHPPFEIRRLIETLKAAQGDTDVDESVLPTEPPPGDYQVDDGHIFGVPDQHDPDPYGVLALEKEGLSLKEAATHQRASWQDFSFNPSPNSPVHAVYSRNSQERNNASRRNSWRASVPTLVEPRTSSSLRNSIEQPKRSIRMSDMSTQTEPADTPNSPGLISLQSGISKRSSRRSSDNSRHSSLPEVPEHRVLDTSPDRKEPQNASAVNGYSTPPHTPPFTSPRGTSTEPDDEPHEDEDIHIEEPVVVHSIQHVQANSPQVTNPNKPRLVSVPKRLPPKLPARNPNRGSGPLVIDASPETVGTPDDENAASPADEVASHGRSSASSPEPVAENGIDVDAVAAKVDHIQLEDNEEDDNNNNNTTSAKTQGEMQDIDLEDHEPESVLRDPWTKTRESMPGGFD